MRSVLKNYQHAPCFLFVPFSGERYWNIVQTWVVSMLRSNEMGSRRFVLGHVSLAMSNVEQDSFDSHSIHPIRNVNCQSLDRLEVNEDVAELRILRGSGEPPLSKSPIASPSTFKRCIDFQ